MMYGLCVERCEWCGLCENCGFCVAFALVIDNVPIECLETLEINGISFKGYVASTPLRNRLKNRLFTMFVRGELHLLSDESFKIIRNL